MVAIPVRLYKAARRERVRFHHVYAPVREPEPAFEPEPEPAAKPARGAVHPFPAPTPTPPVPAASDDEPADYPSVSRVRETIVGEADAKPVPRAEILKGFETARDEYVVFKPDEIAALRPRTSTELPIIEFVRLEEIDPIYFDTSYYLAPDQGGERPFALLAAALEKTGYAALGSLAMHGREHAVVIRADRRALILHTLFYANEVRADEAWRADAAPVNEKELELATILVKSMEAPFDPSKLKDEFEERLRALIEKRAPTPARAEGAPRTAPPPAIDIMEALRKSIEAKRKPVEPERRPARAAKSAREKRRRA